MGVFSTPYLHYACLLAGRKLVSYENDANYAKFFMDYGYGRFPLDHDIRVVSDWDYADIDQRWGVALIDHSPSERRIVDIRRLANKASYIIIHDSNGRHEQTYHYSEIYPLFKYRTIWDKDSRHATVLSNFVDLGDFWE
jgi:hypothetical protein